MSESNFGERSFLQVEGLPGNPDCISTNPVNKSVLAIGAYNYDSKLASRRGGLLKINLEHITLMESTDLLSESISIIEEGALNSPQIFGLGISSVDKYVSNEIVTWVPSACGVLDLKWIGPEHVLCACSDTSLMVVTLPSHTGSNQEWGESGVTTKIIALTCQMGGVSDSLDLCISVDANHSVDKFLAISTKGYLYEGRISSLDIHDSRLVHDKNTETWCCCYADDGRIAFSGADDRSLMLTDFRSPTSISLHGDLIHSAGITSVCNAGNLLLTGSYDEYVKFTDLRKLPTPSHDRLIHIDDRPSLKLDGGVWSMTHRPADYDQKSVLVSCCFGGVDLISNDTDVIYGTKSSHIPAFTSAQKFACKGALVYGSDFIGYPHQGVACLDFYDRKLNLFRL